MKSRETNNAQTEVFIIASSSAIESISETVYTFD